MYTSVGLIGLTGTCCGVTAAGSETVGLTSFWVDIAGDGGDEDGKELTPVAAWFVGSVDGVDVAVTSGGGAGLASAACAASD